MPALLTGIRIGPYVWHSDHHGIDLFALAHIGDKRAGRATGLLNRRHGLLGALLTERPFPNSSGGDFPSIQRVLVASDASHWEPAPCQLHPRYRTCQGRLDILCKTTVTSHPRQGDCAGYPDQKLGPLTPIQPVSPQVS